MPKRELDKELEVYLSARKRKKRDVKGMIKKILPKPAPKSVELPPEVQAYDASEEISKAEPKLDVDVVMEDEYEEERKSIVQKITDWLRPNPKEIHVDDQEREIFEEEKIKEMVGKEMIMHDLKAVSKIALYVIKQLPPEQLNEFKNSSDFAELKEILKKNQLIK